MAIIAKQGSGNFIPCPPGLHQAVCVDVVDIGMVKTTYNGKSKEQHKIRMVWQIDEMMDDGRRYVAQRRYTCSLDRKASLRKDLESWRGKPFTEEQLKGFDLEVLVGVNCQINVVHEAREGETYANVTTVVPLSKGMSKIEPLDYRRVKDRDDSVAAANHNGTQNSRSDAYEASDDDVPYFEEEAFA